MKPSSGSLFPDLFVLGAQKSGTTSLCAWLDQLPEIAFSRPKEPMLIARDEVSLHPHFFAQSELEWDRFRWPDCLHQYEDYFSHAPEGALLADGSTSYLYSHFAPARIHEIMPDAKFIVILRDPALRSYSAYQHYLRHGIACEPFLQHIQYEGGMTIEGSEYASHIKRWLSVFPREQFHFMLYEQLKTDRDQAETALLDFLGLQGSLGMVPQENRAKAPRSEALQRFLNAKIRQASQPPAAIQHPGSKKTAKASGMEWLRNLNLASRPYPPMEVQLHHRLDQHFRRANSELAQLTGLDVSAHWYRGPKV